jgi:hypothetical protein
MIKNLTNNQIPVLFEISNLPKDGTDYFKLDEEDFTLFKEEKEVLLRDGL